MYIFQCEKLCDVENWIQEGIYRLIELSDKEFVPPLSSRFSTIQQDLKKKSEENKKPIEYFEKIKNQKNLISIENGAVIGFMSFRFDYTCEEIPRKFIPNIYISTVIVDEVYRNKGIASKFYEKLMQNFGERNIFTRTWSGNIGHIRALQKKGFELFFVKKNDRGFGIDTVYFRKLVN